MGCLILTAALIGHGWANPPHAYDEWTPSDDPEQNEELIINEWDESLPVVGGTPVPQGRWDDAAGVVFNSQYVGCTGVLIAPNLALTAGHCAGGISHVMLGSKDYYQDSGEIIAVAQTRKYGDVYDGIDVALLILEEDALTKPRIIASDCIVDEYLDNDSDVAVVGYGNTQSNGSGGTSTLHEGDTFVQDYDCSEDYIDGMYTGCNPSVRPGGEIAAGGNEVDACFGDSGGPLYLYTPIGEFLIGITSRAYAGSPGNQPCMYGGIYGRPDYIIDWIEEESGETLDRPQCNAPPELSAAVIETGIGGRGSTVIVVEDEDGEPGEHIFALAEAAEHGEVWVLEDGTVKYNANGLFGGSDSFVVQVTDAGDPEYDTSPPISVDIDIEVVGGGCACATNTRPWSMAALLVLLPLVLLRRQRD